jgi:ribosomal protein S27AE
MKQASTPIPSPSSKRASDLDQVRDLLRSLLAEGRTEEAIDVALTMLGQLQAHNTDLVLQLAKFRREQSGRRSERIDPAQLSLLLELAGPSETSEESDRTATEEEDAALTAERDTLEAEAPLAERGQARRRRPSPALPREVTRHELSEKERLCADCGEVMPAIGVDVSEVVELVPAHFRVEEHRRVKYACGKCKSAVKTAPGPPKLILE